MRRSVDCANSADCHIRKNPSENCNVVDQTNYDVNNMPSITYEGDKVIHLTGRNMVQGKLPNSQKLVLLYDSGASKTLISQTSINSAYLSGLERQKITKPKFQVGSGDYIIGDYIIAEYAVMLL